MRLFLAFVCLSCGCFQAHPGEIGSGSKSYLHTISRRGSVTWTQEVSANEPTIRDSRMVVGSSDLTLVMLLDIDSGTFVDAFMPTEVSGSY
jgi:hypothetical protein